MTGPPHSPNVPPPRDASKPPAVRRRPPIVLIIGMLLTAMLPLLFWHGTWFGRTLTDEEIKATLEDAEHPRKIQHALVQLSERIVQGDDAGKSIYPQIIALADHPSSEVRSTAAWVMAEDNASDEFHATLRRMVTDPEPLVRRNAALGLSRFGDPGGRSELLAMLRPYNERAPHAGTILVHVAAAQRIGSKTLLAQIKTGSGEMVDIRSPLSGRVGSVLVEEGAKVATGDEICVLLPGAEHVWEALRALYLVGRPEDLFEVNRIARGWADMPQQVRLQAELTANGIRYRAQERGNALAQKAAGQ